MQLLVTRKLRLIWATPTGAWLEVFLAYFGFSGGFGQGLGLRVWGCSILGIVGFVESWFESGHGRVGICLVYRNLVVTRPS